MSLVWTVYELYIANGYSDVIENNPVSHISNIQIMTQISCAKTSEWKKETVS